MRTDTVYAVGRKQFCELTGSNFGTPVVTDKYVNRESVAVVVLVSPQYKESANCQVCSLPAATFSNTRTHSVCNF
jgi:hypothetical protein